MAVDGKVVYEVDYNTDKAKTSLKGLNVDLKATGEKMSNIGSNMTSKVTLPIVAGATAGIVAFKEFSEALDETKKSAIGVGAGVEGLQALQFAGRKAGVENDKLTDSLKKTQEIIGNNEKGFNDLGVSTRDLNGDARDTDLVFTDLLNKFSAMDDVTRRETALGIGFTEELTTINKLLDENSGFLDNYATGLQNAVSEEDIAKFEAFNDSLEDIKGALVPVATDLAMTVLPYFQEFADWFESEGIDKVEEGLPKLLDFIIEYKEVIAGIALAGPVLSTTGKAMTVIAKLVPFLNPVGIGWGMVGGLTAAGWEEMQEAIATSGEAGEKLRSALRKLIDVQPADGWFDFIPHLTESFSELDGILLNIKDTLTSLLDIPLEGFNDIIDGVNKLTGSNIPKAVKIEDLTSGLFEDDTSDVVGTARRDTSMMTSSVFSPMQTTSDRFGLNVGSLSINASTTMSPGNTTRFTNEVMEKMSENLQIRGTFK